MIFALGHGGQYLMLVPDLDLTMVTTARYSVGRQDADQTEQEISGLLALIIREAKRANNAKQ